MHEPYSHTVATQHYLTDFWLCSQWPKVTPRTWKPSQRRQKTHSVWGCLPWFHRHHSLFSLGGKVQCFTPGFTVGPAASCQSLFQGKHRPYRCSQRAWREGKKFTLIFLHPATKKDELDLKQPFSFRAILLNKRPFFHMTCYLLIQASTGAAGACSLYFIAHTVMVPALCFLSQKWAGFSSSKINIFH